ncbi:hypothetical protein C8J56DRAFT_1065217 [Mycena floridula]|nr:hypothetical protein C8J56DRAFT_1065217 [Mycena floridula]
MEGTDSTQPCPQLPFELVCLIIDELTRIDPKRALDLMTLSRDFKPIVERSLYHTVVLHSEGRSRLATESFLRMIESGCRSPSFYHQMVQTLCLMDVTVLPDLFSLLSTCSGVQKLGIFNSWAAEVETLMGAGPQPTRLSCDFNWLLLHGSFPFPYRVNVPLFQSVTHLELYNYAGFATFDGTPLHSLTNLTHLALNMVEAERPDVITLVSSLSLADSIVLCIVFPQFLTSEAAAHADFVLTTLSVTAFDRDPRMVVALAPHFRTSDAFHRILWRDLLDSNHFKREWGTRPSGAELDMWEEAENVAKMHKELILKASAGDS